MAALEHFFPTVAVVAALLLATLAGTRLSERVPVPPAASFLAIGVAAALLGISPVDELSISTIEQIGALALYAILFQGGLSTGFAAWRRSAAAILALGLPGTFATAAALAGIGHYGLGLDWSVAVLIGIALAPTDPAAVYSVLRGRASESRARTILEGESGFNDPAGITLMVVAVTFLANDDASIAAGVGRFVQEFGIGVGGGLVGAVLLTWVLRVARSLEESLQSVAILAGAVAVGASTASLHGSGFLAVYVCGLLVADRWSSRAEKEHAVPEAVAAVGEVALFGLLGAAFASSVGASELANGLLLTLATALVVRPAVAELSLLGSGLARRERALVATGGLKGAVPLLLAGFPALESLGGAEAVAATVLVATVASLVLQGVGVSLVARRL